MSSGGAVGGGAIASTNGGLGNWASTVKKSKKKRTTKYGHTILQREDRQSADGLFKQGYESGRYDGLKAGKKDRDHGLHKPEYFDKAKHTGPHDPSKRGRVTIANAYDKGYQAGYQDAYYNALTGGVE